MSLKVEQYEQPSMFDDWYENYKIKKPIRLIELFAGYGSQALSLKYLGVKFESYKTCEWAIKSIQAYKDIHFPNDNYDYSKDLSSDQLIDYLYSKGVSSNYNEPMQLKQIQKLKENELRTIYNNIFATHNLVNIQQVKAKDLEIVDTDKYEYILTYSFPCQDLSLAGNKKGMEDTSTRSGMLWEVERILDECENLPQILLMENVPQVHNKLNQHSFEKWLAKLEKLGYSNNVMDLNAKNFGVPQNRERTFVLSILGDYNYKKPTPFKLERKLKDLLEKNVDEKYYLSKKMIKCFIEPTENGEKFHRREHFLSGVNCDVAKSITTKAGARDMDNYICDNDKMVVGANMILIKEKTKQGYKPAYDGDVINISNRMSKQRGNVQSGMIQTLTTHCGDDRAVVETQTDNLRIRKLTPRECFRLMGVKDEDFDKVSKNQSDSSLFHLAGDSIVVDVLMNIFKGLV